MAGVLEGVDEWVDVWGEAMGGGPIIIDNLSSQHYSFPSGTTEYP